MASKISLIKKLLSYLNEIPLEKTSSAINPVLEVYLTEGKIKLLTRNATYSYADRYTVFSEAFRQIKSELKEINNVLILGYGLGSIPYILKKKYRLSLNFTGVEIDPTVIGLAKKYGFNQNVNFIISDAMHFVEGTDSTFDLICVDIFIDSKVPQKFTDLSFLKKLEKLLNPGGILLFNRLTMTPPLQKEALKYFERTFKSNFPAGEKLQTPHNMVMYARNQLS